MITLKSSCALTPVPRGLTKKERLRRVFVWDARPPCLTNHFRSVAWENFEQVVFAVLLGEEKRRSVFLEFFCPDQAVDRDASLGHVQRGRLIIFVRCHLIEAERDESGHYGSSRTQFVSQIDSTFCKYVKCQPRGKIGDCIFN
jgi:hypothetical protein